MPETFPFGRGQQDVVVGHEILITLRAILERHAQNLLVVRIAGDIRHLRSPLGFQARPCILLIAFLTASRGDADGLPRRVAPLLEPGEPEMDLSVAGRV